MLEPMDLRRRRSHSQSNVKAMIVRGRVDDHVTAYSQRGKYWDILSRLSANKIIH